MLSPAILAAPPPHAPAQMQRAVSRWAEPEGEEPRMLIAPAGEEGADGPDGFRAVARRLAPGTRYERVVERGWVRSLHVLRGRLRCADGVCLARFDARLHEEGERIVVEPASGAEVLYLELAFRKRGAPTWPRSSRAWRGRRLARLAEMRPLRSRVPLRWLPAGMIDLLSPRDLYPVIGPVPLGPGRFRIVGPEELVVVIATTPPGTGPALHVHTLSTEMFVVLEGRFRISWGENGEHASELSALDAIVIPRGVNRDFQAVGEGPCWIMPIVVGASDETKDIVWLEDVGRRIEELAPAWLTPLMQRSGRFRIGRRAG